MNQKLLALACLAALALAACKRDEPAGTPAAAEPPPAETAAAPAAPTDPIVPTADAPVEAPAFDKKAFAGRFSGGGAKLELKPDGGYVIEDSQGRMDGTWTVEADDKRIRLDPNTKAQEDRLFAIVGPDELGALGADGQPAAGQAGLRREDAAAATR